MIPFLPPGVKQIGRKGATLPSFGIHGRQSILKLLNTQEFPWLIDGFSWCRGAKTVASMLFELVSKYGVSGGSGGLKNTRITQRRRNDIS